MAHAEDYKRKSSYFDFMSSDPITESLSDRLISGQLEEGPNDPGTNGRAGHEAYNSPLERAAACEESAQRLTLLVENL